MERRWAGRSTLCLWPVFHIVSQLAWSKLRFSSLSAKDLSDLGFIYLPDYHLHASSPSPSCYSDYSSWKITQVADPQGVELLASGDRAHLALALRGRIQPAQSLLHVGSDASDLFSLNNGYGIFVSIGLSPGCSELVFCVGLFFFFSWGSLCAMREDVEYCEFLKQLSQSSTLYLLLDTGGLTYAKCMCKSHCAHPEGTW